MCQPFFPRRSSQPTGAGPTQCADGGEAVIQEMALADHPWVSRAFWNVLFVFPLRNHLEGKRWDLNKTGVKGFVPERTMEQDHEGPPPTPRSFSQGTHRTGTGLRCSRNLSA